MLNRQPLLPNKGAALKTLWSEFVYIPFPKSTEEQSIVSWSSPGKGMNGEHSTGISSSEELYRTNLMGRQWGAK